MPVYVITGARRGIGPEYVRQTASVETNTVIALVRDLDADLTNLKEIQAGATGQVHVVPCDVSSDESVCALDGRIAELLGPEGKVDVLINNAAIQRCKGETPLNLRADTLLAQVDANCLGPVRVIQSLLTRFSSAARIANISSGMGSCTLQSDGSIAPHVTSYSISKAALNMATVHQAYALKAKVIIVVIDPGHVKTDMGGPKAVMAIADSAKHVLDTVHGLSPKDTGKFFKYDGTEIPW
jgi:NAD(P)-dependent dehydrogenase (short-subunit alcohol dehydrogenase family)